MLRLPVVSVSSDSLQSAVLAGLADPQEGPLVARMGSLSEQLQHFADVDDRGLETGDLPSNQYEDDQWLYSVVKERH